MTPGGAVEEVTFENGDIKLSGVLIRPNIEGRHPAIVMLHGSGPGTHDEMFFRIHTNVFVRQGFAVLSYDKRGAGRSQGDFDSATYKDFIHDAQAGIRYLRNRSDIVPDLIGLFGSSEVDGLRLK